MKTKCLHGLQALHLLIGSTIMLKMVGGAGDAEGYGHRVRADSELRHSLQQQKSMKRQTAAPLIMAPGLVNVQ